MSLSSTVLKALDQSVTKFIKQLASNYGLDEEELRSLWDGKEKLTSTTKSSVEPVSGELASENNGEEELKKLPVKELQALCKQKGLKVSGTKAVLIGRLTGNEVEVDKKVKKETQEKVKKNAASVVPAVKNLMSKVPTVNIRRNGFNNYEHPESSLVFDIKSRKVIGKQNDDGSIDELTAEDLEVCKRYNFSYDKLPENLGNKTDLNDVEVGELDEVDGVEEEETEEGDVEEEELLGSGEEYEEYEEEIEDDD